MRIKRKAAAVAAASGLALTATSAVAAPQAAGAMHARECPSGWVALTFDDGPSYYRPFTLQTLRRTRVPATFFDVGMRVAANPQLTRFEAREGHLVLNHTYYHPNLNNLRPDEVRDEVLGTEAAIRAAGVNLTFRGVRPPFLAANDQVRAVLAGIGYNTVILADVVTDDSNAATTPEKVRDTIFAGLSPNAILLLHDGNIDTPAGASVTAALPSIINGARARGYCFGTLNRQGNVKPAEPLKPSKKPIPQIINPVPYLPLVEDLRGDPPQDPPQPYVIVPSPHA